MILVDVRHTSVRAEAPAPRSRGPHQLTARTDFHVTKADGRSFCRVGRAPITPTRWKRAPVTTLTQKIVVRFHDAKLQRDLRRDEAGLTMLAYALGAAVIIVPLAAAVLTLGTRAVTDAEVKLDAALA